MALNDVGSFTLGEINVGLAAGIGLMNPLLLQVDLMLTGQFGLGPLLADVQVQFNAAIAAVASISLGLSNPLDALNQLIIALASVQASLAIALALGLPSISLQATAQISAIAALGAALALKLGGIRALINAGLGVKIPALRFVAEISAALAAGPCHLLSFTGDPLATTGAEIQALFNAGLGPSDPIPPTQVVSGILLVTKDPAVFTALAAIMRTS